MNKRIDKKLTQYPISLYLITYTKYIRKILVLLCYLSCFNISKNDRKNRQNVLS